MRAFLCAAVALAVCVAGYAGGAQSGASPAPQASQSWPSPSSQTQDWISGVVLGPDGPAVGATVRIQATTRQTTSDAYGWFLLTGLQPGVPVTVSAWAEGMYCAKLEGVMPQTDEITLTLRPYQVRDNPDYTWIPPTGENSCYSCKAGVTQVWLDNDVQGRSATNPRFLTLYYGTDVQGRQSPPTRYGINRDYGRIPLLPDPGVPYYGPGYKLDFPDAAGNCAACHLPGAAVDAPYDTDPNVAFGADLFGIHCDFCHKIAGVILDPDTGLPFPNTPGVLSMDIRRPFPEDQDRYQLFFGPFDDDNVPQEDTYLPLIQESQFCAPCHFGVFWDAVIYNSFGEWLASPYSDPSSGKTCQQCHTPAPTLQDGGPITNVAPGKGGVERDPRTIAAHTFPGASGEALLQNAVTMTATARLDGPRLVVQVAITNDQTGHHVPTDSPLRHLILLVGARDAAGTPLAQLGGPTVPEWGGLGDPARGYYAGQPKKAFAKVLRELWTEVTPTAAYWNPTRVLSDNRLAAFATDTSSYFFEAPGHGSVSVQVTLLLRRAYRALVDQKGWDAPDIVMEQVALHIP